MTDYRGMIMKQGQRLTAQRAQLQAELAEYESMGLQETERALDIGQAILDVNHKGALLNQELDRLNNQAQAPEISDAEFMAMSPERLTQNPGLVDRIFAKSKYYSKDQWSDPEVAKRVYAGMAEVRRRRAEGQ